MNKTTTNTTTTEEANVSRVAYQLWEDAGRPSGRDLEFWLTAEAKVRTASSEAPLVSSAAPAPFKTQKATRPAAGGARKTWPKPYPNLPKF